MLSGLTLLVRRSFSDRALAVAVGAVAFATYWWTLLPGAHHFGDTTKAQFLGKFLGMTHPTGYPLYIALTALFGALPVGSLALRINAFSAVCGAGAGVFLFLLLRDRGVRPVFALLSAFAFCWSRMAWDQAVIAEVYALNVLLFGAVLFALSRLERTKRPRWFLIASAVYSLSFGNHLTMVMLLPAFCYGVLKGERRVLTSFRPLLGMILTIVLGAAQYYYLIARSQSDALYLEYRVTSFEELFNFVSGANYRRVMFAFTLEQILSERIPRFLLQLWRDVGPFSLFGLLVLLPKKASDGLRPDPVRMTLFLALAFQLVWVVGYKIPDIEVYLIPAAFCLAALAGLGLELLAGALGPRALGPVSVVGAVCTFVLLLQHKPDHSASERFAQATQKQLDVLDRDAAIIGITHYSPRMAYIYFLYAEGLQERRNLHLSYKASPKKVAAYLRGEQTLRDSPTREPLPPGLALYVDSRGARAERWQQFGLRLSKARAGLRRVTLAP